ncbi:MAG: IPT/TIG domain-containing protein, partial [Candidatus Acidiferrales bacterium]
MRLAFAALALFLLLVAFCATASAQTNPVPFVNAPLAPAAAVPGSAGFTLKVNGTGFVSGAAVRWNGSPRPTTFVSSIQITAAIPASDLAMVATIPVTVSNPAPGGGISNVALFEVATPTTSLAFTRTDTDLSFGGSSNINAPADLAVGYLPNDLTPLLSIADNRCPAPGGCRVESGVIATTSGAAPSLSFTAFYPDSVAAGDFNG